MSLFAILAIFAATANALLSAGVIAAFSLRGREASKKARPGAKGSKASAPAGKTPATAQKPKK